MGHHTFWGFCLLACLAGTSLGEGSPKIQGRAKCLEGAIYYQRRCYHPVYKYLAWDDAEIECQNLKSGGHLASFQTAAEERLVSSHIRSHSTATDAWIGMHVVQVGTELRFQWSDGASYTPGKPLWGNGATRDKDDCISITNIRSPRNAIRWIQRSCYDALPFVCKYKPSF